MMKTFHHTVNQNRISYRKYDLMETCLQEHGHRVRLATHANFKDFVLTAGLEFFPLGGDPKVLAGCKC
jgi:UDP:flavonoid glycosyltransferase YjiC (YdhE family)